MLELPYVLISDPAANLARTLGVAKDREPPGVHRAMFVVETDGTIALSWISPDDATTFPDPDSALDTLRSLSSGHLTKTSQRSRE
jgi:peroxiredoxin